MEKNDILDIQMKLDDDLIFKRDISNQQRERFGYLFLLDVWNSYWVLEGLFERGQK